MILAEAEVGMIRYAAFDSQKQGDVLRRVWSRASSCSVLSDEDNAFHPRSYARYLGHNVLREITAYFEQGVV